MASRRSGGHLVSGHSASAGSDGAAKKRRNVDTRVARTTLTARASRLRMYVSTGGYLPARVAPMVGTRDEPGPPPRQSVQNMRPGEGAVVTDLLVEPDLRDLRHALVRVVDHVLHLGAEDVVALVVVVRDGQEVVLHEPLVHLAPLRALLGDRELQDALDLGVDLGVGEVAEGRATLREGAGADGGRDDGVGRRPVEAPAARRLEHVVLAVRLADDLATLLPGDADVGHLEAGSLELLLADLVDLLGDVVVVRVVVDELERLVRTVAGVGEHLLRLLRVAVALAVHAVDDVVEVARDLRRDHRAGRGERVRGLATGLVDRVERPRGGDRLAHRHRDLRRVHVDHEHARGRALDVLRLLV